MLKAINLGADFAALCTLGAFGRVHSVFDRTINIHIKGKMPSPLITITTNTNDIMTAVVIVKGNKTPCHINDSVILANDVIYINNTPFVYGLSNATVWQPLDIETLNLPKLTCKEVFHRCKKIEAFVTPTYSPEFGLLGFCVKEILGHGIGLTPSGDDFLAGVLFALHFKQKVYNQQYAYLNKISKEIRQNMPRMTNEISRHFLSYAMQGSFGLNTQDFLVSFYSEDLEAVKAAVQKKLDCGATSGADELQGILWGLENGSHLK
ncbi:MAG: DUF2877 domain-containing protein [Defluviitaleaceae bacterium]|nr:DUF2877 domain-containing protein [Defluviitaleaceae bacterium]